MAALGDTPTPPQPLLAAPQVSIKLEQEVLHEEVDYGNALHGGLNALRNLDESGHLPEKQDKSNEISSASIKNEPALDIDDTYENSSTDTPPPLGPVTTQMSVAHSPIIRIKPTTKLMPTPNPANPKRRYECPFENCTKSYGKSSHLRSHLTWHTGIKPFVCQDPGCGKGFTRSDELNRHVRTHTGEKPFECSHCSKKFSRSDHLTKHLATHTKQMGVAMLHTSPSKRAKMETRRKESVTPINIPKSPSSSESSPMELNDVVRSSKSMKFNEGMHFMATFAQKDESVENHQQENIDVQKSLDTGANNIRDEYDDDAIMPEANLPPLPMSTMIATAVAPSPPSVNMAIPLAEGPHSKDIIYPMYDPSRPFACTECTKKFKRPDDLNRHMRTHTAEKPFACNECEKRFTRSDHLKKHLNTHTRIR